MEPKIEEFYTNDGRELFDLIQEWIDENNSILCCKNREKNENITVYK